MLRAGIVGLPNVGKSTLFNALTRSHKADCANYPFCTIEPNLGVLQVPDSRLPTIAKLLHSARHVPAAIELCDIAGLVKDASRGEGLGNQFLAHIRETDAIVQVVRCFEDQDVPHVLGTTDPARDLEIIATELILADLASVERQVQRATKQARGGDAQAAAELHLLERIRPHLDSGRPAIALELSREDARLARGFFLLSAKPLLVACNIAETDLADPARVGEQIESVRRVAAQIPGTRVVTICAQLESELADLDEAEAREYLATLSLEESGSIHLIREIYALLGLRTFFTGNAKESRAWTFHEGDCAPAAAGRIHSDFERGFIAAEVIHFDDLLALGTLGRARETGKLRIEGKEYRVHEGDVIEFRFHV
jgi:ribosome-binding ATPase